MADSVPLDAATPDLKSDSELRWRGVTWLDVMGRMLARDETCERRIAEHDRSARIWRRIATPLAWMTAVLAAVSGLSFITDRVELAASLSLVTAVVAATNAALSPADTARAHRASALAYERLRLRIDDLYFDIQDEDARVPPEDAKSIREKLRDIDKELNAIAENSPPTRRIELPR